MYEVDDREGLGLTLANLAACYLQQGHPHRSIGYSDQAVVIAQETNSHAGEAARLNILGLGHACAGDTRDAVTCYRRALYLARQICDRYTEGRVLANLGNLLADLLHIPGALLHLHSAVDLSLTAGDRRGTAAALDRLAALYYHFGAHEPAHRMLLRALQTYEDLAAPRADHVRHQLTDLQTKTTGPRGARAWQFVYSG